MIFSKNVRRIVVTLGVASPFILSMGTASAHVVTAKHAQIAARPAVMAQAAGKGEGNRENEEDTTKLFNIAKGTIGSDQLNFNFGDLFGFDRGFDR